MDVAFNPSVDVVRLRTDDEETRNKQIHKQTFTQEKSQQKSIYNSPSSGVCTVRSVQGPAPTLVLARIDIR